MQATKEETDCADEAAAFAVIAVAAVAGVFLTVPMFVCAAEVRVAEALELRLPAAESAPTVAEFVLVTVTETETETETASLNLSVSHSVSVFVTVSVSAVEMILWSLLKCGVMTEWKREGCEMQKIEAEIEAAKW